MHAGWRIRVPLVPRQRGGRGPYRDGLGVAPSRGAQVPAAVQAVEQRKPSRRSARRSGGIPAGAPRRPRCGLPADPASPSESAVSPGSTGRPHPGTGPAPPRRLRSAAARSPASISTLGQDVAAQPGYPAGDVGRDLLGLPGQPHGAVEVTGAVSGDAEVRQGQRLPGRVAELPGQGQGTAGVLGCLGGPAQVRQCRLTGRPGSQPAPGTAAGPRWRRGPR